MLIVSLSRNNDPYLAPLLLTEQTFDHFFDAAHFGLSNHRVLRGWKMLAAQSTAQTHKISFCGVIVRRVFRETENQAALNLTSCQTLRDGLADDLSQPLKFYEIKKTASDIGYRKGSN